MIVIAVLLSLLIAMELPGTRASASGVPPGSLRVVTFNLYHGGPWSGLSGDDRHLERRLETVIEELRALHPDVIGLQEASVGRGRGNVAGRVAAGLGLFHVYAPTNPHPFGGAWVHRALAALLNFSEGPAIVSRFPLGDWRVHRLPRCTGAIGESRALLSATLDTPWGPQEVSSAHTRGDPCQTTAVANLVSRGPHPLPGILMGDFNAVEGSPALAPFREGARFVDAFRVANPTEPGPTVWQRLDAPESTVSRRVDHIFLLPGERIRGSVLSSRVVLNRPRRLEDVGILWPSDHYGVLVDVGMVLDSSVGSRTSNR